ncbi:MAG: DUF2232 domain-containing protein [Hyphomicrobiaceae bacterium]
MLRNILIAAGAGLASIVLFLSAARGTPDTLLLFCLAPLPVALAGFGWGWASAALAAAIATGVAGLIGSIRFALIYLLAFGGPAAVFTYLLMLCRQVAPEPAEAGGGGVEWYPVGRLLAWITLWAGVLAGLVLLTTASDTEAIRRAIESNIDSWALRGPDGRSLSTEQKQALSLLAVKYFLPWVVSTGWLLLTILNMWMAAHVTRLSGRLNRPWPDLSSTTLPPGFALAFGAAVGLSFVAGLVGSVAWGFANALMFAFMLQGLAILHGLTRAHQTRVAILALVYLSLVMFSPLSGFLVAILGLAEPLVRGRRPPPAAPPLPPPSST